MLFAKSLALCATLIAAVAAQGRIAFTILPNTMQAGKDITLHWGGGNGAPVTITLKQGDKDNLQTVTLVTGSATGNSYTWKVPSVLPNAQNYAFGIQQGNDEPNYTGLISLTGGTTGASNAVSALASVTAGSSASSSSSGSASASSSSGSNSTITATATAVANATVTANSSMPASMTGTGMSMSRNTTMSRATLSATSSSPSSTPATTTSEESSTGTGSSASATSSSASAAQLASNFALLVCAFAGVAYLG